MKKLHRIDVKTFPVVFTKAVFIDGVAVFAGAVTFIAVPAVVGKFAMELLHVFIPPGFGEDARGGDRGKNGIASHDTTVRSTPVADESISVDQQQLWPYFQLVERQVHGFKGCFQNIDTVDLVVVYACYGPGHGVGFDIRS